MAAASRPMAPYARKEEGGREGGKGGCGGGDSYARIQGKERRGGSLVPPPLLNAPEMGEPRGGGEDDSLVISE